MIRSIAFSIGLRYFLSGGRNNRLVSFISLLALGGLSLGVGLLILVLSVMNGFDREMRDHVLSIVPHIEITQPNYQGDWQAQAALLATVPNVTEVSVFSQVEGLIFSADKTRPVRLLGLDSALAPSGLMRLLHADGHSVPNDRELLLPSAIAVKLDLVVGQMVNVVLPSNENRLAKAVPLKLVGLFDTQTELDQMLGIVSLEQAARLSGSGAAIRGFRVQITDLFDARLMGYRLLNQLPKGFQSKDWMKTYGNLYQAIQLSRNMVGLLVFLIIGVAAFNVISMLMMAVLNKRKDIAILQTLGLSRKHIFQLFIVQGGLIAIVGILGGLIIGIGSCYLIEDIASMLQSLMGIEFLDTSIYPINYLPVDLRGSDILSVSLSAFVLTLLAALFPALKASKTVPAETLRYEA
ncbi:MAG: FtsX-like permease family protein [Cellvibrionales bacterium]|nr:FtsX-like permease family protein [Cellvibrionales bacterium]